MKKNIKTIAVFAALSLIAASCQKDETVLLQQSSVQEATSNNVKYTIDGKEYCQIIRSEQDWSDFLYRMLALAEEGHIVSISSRVAATSLAKEVVTYTTTNKTEAFNWADSMSDQGYDVTISYDNTTGVYTCIAVRKP